MQREGIELSGTFVATVNADLKVGSLQETITVTGETPIVDVQSAKVQNIVPKDILAAIPTSRNATGIQALIPGMATTGDAGGITGGTGGGASSMHGGRPSDSRTLSDGLNMGWAGANSNAAVVNVAGSQEVVTSLTGGLGEAETAGVVFNVVPRDGGNTFNGLFVFSGANGSMQSSNYTDALKAAGLRSPSELIKVYEINPMGGGRIVRDRLWFYLTYRESYAENTIPGMFFNRNGGDPTKWLVDFDTSRVGFNDTIVRNYIGRVTWQISPRNKMSFQDSEQYSSANRKGGGSAGLGAIGPRTPEAQGLNLYTPGHTRTLTWSSPVTNKMLLEAGWGQYLANYANDAPRIDGLHNPALISVLEQTGVASAAVPGSVFNGGLPNLTYRFDNPLGGGFQHHQIGTIANLKASVSYITGAQNIKVGYMGGFSNPSQAYYNFTPFVQYRFSGGVPNQLTQTAQFGGTGPSAVEFVRNLVPTSFYAQDQWTRNRLTLQGGVRYDHILTSYPDSCMGGPDYPLMPKQICYPARSTPGVHWTDVTPRIGVAYDLFGNGKTAVKMNIGKYMQALTASNSDMDLNPLIRLNLQTTRTWNDRGGLGTNGDYVPQCDLLNPAANGECGAMDNQNFGKEFFTRTFDPAFIDGYGVRPVQLGDGRVGAAGTGAARRRHGRLLPPMVRQLLHAGQHPDRGVRLHAVQRADPARSAAAGRRRRSGQRHLQPQSQQGWPGAGPRAARQRGRRRADRKLAGRGFQRQRAASERVHRAGGHEHGTHASGQLRPSVGPAGNLSLVHHHRHAIAPRRFGRGIDQAVLPDRRAVHDLVPGPGDVSRAENRCPGERHVAERPGDRDSGQHGGHQRHREQRAAAARPESLVGQHHRQPDSAGDVVFGSSQQHRFPRGEDPPLRADAHAGGDRHLQHPEQRHHHVLQHGVRAADSDGREQLADAVGHRDRAIREVQRAGRFLEQNGETTKARRSQKIRETSSCPSCLRGLR